MVPDCPEHPLSGVPDKIIQVYLNSNFNWNLDYKNSKDFFLRGGVYMIFLFCGAARPNLPKLEIRDFDIFFKIPKQATKVCDQWYNHVDVQTCSFTFSKPRTGWLKFWGNVPIRVAP